MLKRALYSLLVLSLLAGLVLLPSYLPSLSVKVGDSSTAVQLKVKAKNLTLVCPGAAYKSGGTNGTKVGAFDRIGQSGIDLNTNLPAGSKLTALSLSGVGQSAHSIPVATNQLSVQFATEAVAFTISDPTGSAQQSSALIAAASYQTVNSGSLVGTLGSACQRPTAEQWLLGANTNTGRESLLVLSNPASTDATVDLQIFGDQGAIVGSGLSGVSVPANRTSVLPLAGFAPDNSVLAVHVISKGASIASWIQQRTVRGTVSAGADLISPSIEAAKTLSIPGLLKRGTEAASALIAGNNDYADLTPTLELFVPGGKSATVTAQVIGTDSKTFGTVVQQTVSAGTAASISLPGLKDGNYSVFVSSDEPVLGTVQLSRTDPTKTPATDFAWLPAVANLDTARVTVVSNSAISKVSIANPNSVPTQALVTNLSKGVITKVKVPKFSSVVYTAEPGSVISVSAPMPIAATLIADFNSQIAAVPFLDYRNVGGSLSVLVR
jgi:Family of unknown function (DUF5719)